MARKSRKQRDAAPNCACGRGNEGLHFFRAGAYVRQSADGRRKPSDTLETQRDIIENYVAAAPDIELVEFYTDNKKSGTSFERAAFQQLLADIEDGKINCVIVKDLSRLGRNAIDSGYYLEKYFPQKGVRFIAINDSYDSSDGDGGLIIPLKNIIAETYALDIGQKCHAVHRQNILEGRFIGRLSPYGYLKSPEDCHKLIIDAEASQVVRQIFDLSARGYRDGEIVRELNDAGILTPSRYRIAKGLDADQTHVGIEHWTRRTVVAMLTDEVYMGDMVQGKSRQINGKRMSIPRKDWIIVPNTHEAIVSREQFRRVQEQRERNRRQDEETRNTPVPYSSTVFGGKVFCAHCGHPMTRKRQNKDGIYWYRCETQFRYSKSACVQASVKEAELKSAVMTMLRKQAEAVLGGHFTLQRTKPTEDSAIERELNEITRSLGKSGLMLSSLYENMVTGVITQDEFAQMKADYQAQLDSLSNRANELRERKRELSGLATDQYNYADAMSETLCNDTLTAEIIDCLIEKILVNPDKSFAVHFSYQDEFEEVRRVG